MKQVASAGISKALTISIVMFFVGGLLFNEAAVYAQDRKAAKPPAQVEAEAAKADEAMELPGIFKVTPADATEITQKRTRPIAVIRNTQPLFSADADKVTGKARRPERPAQLIAIPKRPDVGKDARQDARNNATQLAGQDAKKPVKPSAKKDAQAIAQAGAKESAKESADKSESKKILIPARLANNAEKFGGSDFHATAYCLKGRTASGEMVRTGLIAADPKVLPLGTLVRIDAGKYSGIYKVADTGGAIKGNKIDIYVPTYREAKLFGRQKIKVTVLDKGGRGKKSK